MSVQSLAGVLHAREVSFLFLFFIVYKPLNVKMFFEGEASMPFTRIRGVVDRIEID
jgi:hypothetical protein